MRGKRRFPFKKLVVVGWDVKVTYYLFAFEAPIAKMDERCGMYRSLNQTPTAQFRNKTVLDDLSIAG